MAASRLSGLWLPGTFTNLALTRMTFPVQIHRAKSPSAFVVLGGRRLSCSAAIDCRIASARSIALSAVIRFIATVGRAPAPGRETAYARGKTMKHAEEDAVAGAMPPFLLGKRRSLKAAWRCALYCARRGSAPRCAWAPPAALPNAGWTTA